MEKLFLVDSGMELYAIILIGLAGKERSVENALATANIINEIQPTDLAGMTYTPVPGTKMYREIETRELVKNLHVTNLHFTSNHASNYVPIDGVLPKDKEAILQILDKAIAGNIPKRNSFQRGLYVVFTYHYRIFFLIIILPAMHNGIQQFGLGNVANEPTSEEMQPLSGYMDNQEQLDYMFFFMSGGIMSLLTRWLDSSDAPNAQEMGLITRNTVYFFSADK